MRKLAILLPLALAGCFGGSGGETTVPLTAVQVPDVGQISVPESFYQQDGARLPSGIAAAWSDLSRAGTTFTPSVAIAREELPEAMSSLHYGLLSIRSLEGTADYELRERRDVTLGGEDAIYHLFAAKAGADTRLFMNLYGTRGLTGYTVSAVLPEGADDATQRLFESVVLSFEFAK